MKPKISALVPEYMVSLNCFQAASIHSLDHPFLLGRLIFDLSAQFLLNGKIVP